MYKHPLDSAVAIFLPTIVLGLINLFIFFQAIELGDRIGALSTLLIAFVGMVAIVKQTVKTNSYTIAGLLLYAMIVTTVVCLFQSLFWYLDHRD